MAQLNPLDLANRKTSVQLNISEEIVEKVTSHKWKSIHEAQYLQCDLEDSGLGTFKVRPKRVDARIGKFTRFLNKVIQQIQDGTLEEKKLERRKLLVVQIEEEIAYLNRKKNETKL